MVVRRTGRTTKRIVDFRFEIPEGLEDLGYDPEFNDSDDEDLNDDGSDEDEADEAPDKKKKKGRGKKKGRRKRKRKGGKKKGGKKGGKKDKKDKKDDKDKDTNTPKHLKVVKQVLRTKKDGSQVVDLTVDVDKINKADKYEFRITKKDSGKTTVVTG